MNPVEWVLNDELSRLVDRLAESVPGGCLQAIGAQNSTLRRRLDEAEVQMAAVRASLLDGYGRWRRALDDVENLWALAAWKSTSPEAAAPDPPAAPAPSAAKNATEQSRTLAA